MAARPPDAVEELFDIERAERGTGLRSTLLVLAMTAGLIGATIGVAIANARSPRGAGLWRAAAVAGAALFVGAIAGIVWLVVRRSRRLRRVTEIFEVSPIEDLLGAPVQEGERFGSMVVRAVAEGTLEAAHLLRSRATVLACKVLLLATGALLAVAGLAAATIDVLVWLGILPQSAATGSTVHDLALIVPGVVLGRLALGPTAVRLAADRADSALTIEGFGWLFRRSIVVVHLGEILFFGYRDGCLTVARHDGAEEALLGLRGFLEALARHSQRGAPDLRRATVRGHRLLRYWRAARLAHGIAGVLDPASPIEFRGEVLDVATGDQSGAALVTPPV